MNPGQYEPWRGQISAAPGWVDQRGAGEHRKVTWGGRAVLQLRTCCPFRTAASDAQLGEGSGPISPGRKADVVAVETTSAGYGQGSCGSADRRTYESPSALGPQIPQTLAACCSSKPALRCCWRWAYRRRCWVIPAQARGKVTGCSWCPRWPTWLRLIETELRAKLEQDVELEFARTAAIDSEGQVHER